MSFNTINHLLFEPKRKELDVELLEEFNPYITAKVVTFLDKNLVELVNETLNVHSNTFDSKEDKFKYFENIIPKSKRRRYEYIKRPKNEKKEEEGKAQIPEFSSRRELDMLEDMSNYLHERTSDSH